MAKYIDIDKAQLEFYKAHEDDKFTPNIITLQTFLLYYPPADVRPVVRGEWIGDGDCIICSNCKTAYTFMGSNFCPNCGADMRGGDAEWESTSSTTQE